ncbi:MAG: prephenate dehydratase [Anaerolineales bacterium]|jgi:prephenate dehydratase
MNILRVALQGEPGAYSELAALEFYDGEVKTIPCPTFDDVFETVGSSEFTNGIIPVENSLAGSIHRNYDLLLRHNLHIVGEYHLRVSHCLLVLPGVEISEVEKVYSHPQALAQCEASLMRLGVERVAAADTAGSARLIRESGDRHAAALASKRAAEVYRLKIAAENMEDNPANYTRFLIISQKELAIETQDDQSYKTSVVFSLDNEPGALFKALSVFALRDIDLTKIESRPIPGKPWEYMFYIDFVGYTGNKTCQRALEHLSELSPFLRVLGSYPRHSFETA